MAENRTHKRQVDSSRSHLSQHQLAAINNARRHSNRLAYKEEKRKEVEERNAAWRALSPQERLKRLDWRLGKGIGAVKSRKRYQKEIEDEQASKARGKDEKTASGKTDEKEPVRKSRRNKQKEKTTR